MADENYGDNREWVRFVICDFGKGHPKKSACKSILAAIDSRVGKGICSASAETLARDADLSVRTAERCLVTLEQHGIISCVRNRSGRSMRVLRKINPAGIIADMQARHPEIPLIQWPE